MEVLFDRNALLSGILKEAKEIEQIASNSAAEKTKKILEKSYDSIIDQYYLYKTTSYYRHGVGVGTCTGENLYRSNNISMLYSGERAEGLMLDINASDMAGYPRISKDQVLNNVLDGIRGVPGNKPSWLINKRTNKHMMMFQVETSFKASIEVETDTFTGTPREIMTQLGKKIEEDYYKKFWEQEWRKAVRTGKYEFFSGNKKFVFK